MGRISLVRKCMSSRQRLYRGKRDCARHGWDSVGTWVWAQDTAVFMFLRRSRGRAPARLRRFVQAARLARTQGKHVQVSKSPSIIARQRTVNLFDGTRNRTESKRSNVDQARRQQAPRPTNSTNKLDQNTTHTPRAWPSSGPWYCTFQHSRLSTVMSFHFKIRHY